MAIPFSGQAEKSTTVQNFDANSGKGDYTQSLKYHAASKHNGQELKCAVDHEGYSKRQIQANVNEKKKTLKLLCECFVTWW